MSAFKTTETQIERIGVAEVNRAGVTSDTDDNSMLCFQGTAKTLDILDCLPGAVYWSDYNCLALPLTKTNLRVMETVARLDEITDDYQRVRSEYLRPNVEHAALYPEPAPNEPIPRAHQIEAFCESIDSFHRGYKGFGQWSEQGLGKSRWAIDFLRYRGSACSVIICQNSTSYQWDEHLERSWPEAERILLVDRPMPQRVAAIEAVRRRLRQGGTLAPVVLIVNWEALARLVDHLVKLRPTVTVADEATRMIHRTTLMSKAAYKLAKASTMRIPMTGTPVAAHPGDLFALYRFIDERIFGDSYTDYMQTYFELGGFTGKEFQSFKPHRLQEYVERLYCCSYRIVKAAAADMPEKTYRQVRLDMTPRQKKLYKEVEENLFASWTTEQGLDAQLAISNSMTKIGRLQQITAGLMPISICEEGHPERYELIPSAKTQWLVQYFQDQLRETDAKIVAWTRYVGERKAIMALCHEKGIVDPITFIDGSVNGKDRERIRRRFNNRSDPLRILVYQTQAGALGVDLPAADTMIYHTLPFSLLERLQSMERGMRLGRSRPYEIIDLVCKNSVDNHVLQALKRKEDFSKMLLTDGFAGWMEEREHENGEAAHHFDQLPVG